MSSHLSAFTNKKQMKCAGCGKIAGTDTILKSCGACYSVSYCSSECQRTGWPGHKAECNHKKSCAGCGKKASAELIMKGCSACHSVSYCSTECQTGAWKEHRAVCNQLTAKSNDGSGVGIMRSPPSTTPLSSTVRRYTVADCFNACAQGRLEDLQNVLTQGGIDINCAHPDTGMTAVNAAADEGHDKCLAVLIRHGVDLSKAANHGLAPIHSACAKGRVACLSLLLDNGINADVRTGDHKGFTPAVFCVVNGHMKCLALLLDRGSDPNLATSQSNVTPVHMACYTGQLKCLQLLISRGANINAKNSFGETPLDAARCHGHVDCAELLIENHALGKHTEDIPPVSDAVKETKAMRRENAEASREEAKRCDYPLCNASAADKNMAALYKCSRCGEGRYCCHVHGNLDWDRYKLLCNDIKLKVEIGAQY